MKDSPVYMNNQANRTIRHRKRRVAYISADPGVPVFGTKGCSIHVQEVIRALIQHGAQVNLFACRFDGDVPPGLESVQIHQLPHAPKGEPAIREQKCFDANKDLRASLERCGAFDLIYERYSLWSFAGIDYAQVANIPSVLEVNAPLIEEQAKYRDLVYRHKAESVAERVFGSASILVAVSGGIAAYLEGYSMAVGKIQVISNGVNPARFPEGLKPIRPNSPGTFTIGFVGSLKAWHGLNDLIDAFAIVHERLPNSRLLIVGDGPEREPLTAALAARRLLEVVDFTGAVPPEAVPGWLASMDVAVAPYPKRKDFYFSPLKVYEYMAAGLPVVASRIGQLAELIQEGENGLLCPPGDARALANTLCGVLSNPRLRADIGQAARNTVLRNYTWGKIVRRILRLAGVKLNEDNS
jgi:glycosyltransferase involved in cell wall biosynthesis